jgi:hypothetical protein
MRTQNIVWTDRDLAALRGRAVALRTSYGTRVGRLGLAAAAGEISWEVTGLRFVAEAVRTVKGSDVLPVVVLS